MPPAHCYICNGNKKAPVTQDEQCKRKMEPARGRRPGTRSQQQQQKQKATEFSWLKLTTNQCEKQAAELKDTKTSTEKDSLCPKARTNLFGALAHDDTTPLVILQRAVGVPHHLKHVVDGVVHIPGDMGKEAECINTASHSGHSDSLASECKAYTGSQGTLMADLLFMSSCAMAQVSLLIYASLQFSRVVTCCSQSLT